MKCSHEWVKKGNFLYPNAPECRYRCQVCLQEIVSLNGPDPILECKVKEQAEDNAKNWEEKNSFRRYQVFDLPK